MKEIERKFLVLSNQYKAEAFKQSRIMQGYLNSNPERTVRIRVKGEESYLTVKGKSNEAGTTRLEWETKIPLEDARQLLPLCEKGAIDKMRYEVSYGRHIFEVDEFFGDNNGLVIAEVELAAEDEYFEKPQWLGEEVTGDERFYNAYLSHKPYSTWSR
ncbi:CYTH domain-containing protein [Flavobacterium sp. MK4S-17]|uniref:CYTH domain-containing protein n=1 Tax=Flavobacterium sp. MK4S-17 TaxID=2543737 RepID=UPI001357D048|nr:CYTH domain-containing protein [Flavobacterium sp. MK4S-17]